MAKRKPNGASVAYSWRRSGAKPLRGYIPAGVVLERTGQGVEDSPFCWVCNLRGVVELATVCNVETRSPFCGPCWAQHAAERARADLLFVDPGELLRAVEADVKRSRRRRRQKEKPEP